MDALKDILSRYAPKRDRESQGAFSAYLPILRDWDRIIGKTIAKVSLPASFERETLIITVADASWAQELSLMKPEICKNIKDVTGVIVKDIRTRIGDVPQPKTEEREKPRATKETFAMTADERAWVEKTLRQAGIDDKTLRDNLRRALITHVMTEREAEKEQ